MIATAVPFAMLEPLQAYAVWKLRQDVFVVEQECAYPDLDDRDTEDGTRHVLLLDGPESDALLVGYARVLDDGIDWRIGRVLLAADSRGQRLGEPLMETAISICPDRDIVLDAQSPLAGWYLGYGFAVDGEEFLEDGIAHLPMRRSADFAG